MDQVDAKKLYWTQYLRDVEPCIFPALNDGWDDDHDEEYFYDVQNIDWHSLIDFSTTNNIFLSSVYETAWALTLQAYAHEDTVCFGVSGEGKDTIRPLAIQLSSTARCIDLLGEIQSHYLKSQTNISSEALDNTTSNKLFNSILNFGKTPDKSQHGTDFEIEIKVDLHDATATFTSRLRYISKLQAQNIISAFEEALRFLIHSSRSQISNLSLFTSAHAAAIKTWSTAKQLPAELCVHEMVFEQCRWRPDSIAVSSWDQGDWSYDLLGKKTTSLAERLIRTGIRQGERVSTLFDKSGYSVVALLAIFTIGATAVPLDPAQPIARLNQIVRDTEVAHIISSRQHAGMFLDSELRIVIVDDIPNTQSLNDSCNIPRIPTDTIAYILSTSGSTGTPKGVMMSHLAVASFLNFFAERLEFDQSLRSLQFSSFSFTPSIIEILLPLTRGGSVIIPSMEQKEDNLSMCLSELGVNFAFLTPSVIKQIDPKDTHGLKTMFCAGEPLTPEIVESWSPKVQLVNMWASTEVGCIAINIGPQKPSHARQLGFAAGHCRVVEVGNHQKQVPIGAVGEIVVQGPWLATGYANDPEMTSKAFVEMPTWSLEENLPEKAKWYKVGDLVRQNSDGSLVLAGRGDSMVKIRGQKIHLAEIDQKLLSNSDVDAAMTMVTTSGPCRQKVVAVVALKVGILPKLQEDSSEPPHGGLELVHDAQADAAATWVSAFKQRLLEQLPTYMVPTSWIILRTKPLTVSRKLDRMAIKRFVTEMSPEIFERITSLGLKKEMPASSKERSLQAIWSAVLRIPPNKIARNQSFVALGGDSLSAMAVRSQCLKQGMEMSVSDILKHGTIQDLAFHISESGLELDRPENKTGANMRRYKMKNVIDRGLFESSEVEEVYSTTPVQQGMLLSQSRGTGDYDTCVVFESQATGQLQAERLRDAWTRVVARHAALRTVFVESVSAGGFYDQVVLRSSYPRFRVIEADTGEGVSQVFAKHPLEDYAAKQPAHDLTLLQTKTNKSFLRLHIHHTLVDGTSMNLILRDLAASYAGSSLKPLLGRYADYVAHLDTREVHNSASFWTESLGKVTPCILPVLTNQSSPIRELRTVSSSLSNAKSITDFCKTEDITLPSLLRVAWAAVMSAFIGSRNVCYGYLTSGRDLPLSDIHDVVGPYVNMLLCHLSIDERSVIDIIRSEQDRYTASLPHQHTSLAEIQHSLGLSGQRLFNTNLSMLKSITTDTDPSGALKLKEVEARYPTEFDVSIVVQISDSDIRIDLSHWSSTVSSFHAASMLSAFESAIISVAENPLSPGTKIDLLSQASYSQLVKWNSSQPDVIESCVHDLVSERSAQIPHKIAIESWDGSLTYGELDEMSGILAQKLVSLGVRPESNVILCSEKRKLAPVCILAVLKAGGCLVCIDPAHPKARLQKISHDTSPVCVLTSPLHEGIFRQDGLSETVLLVEDGLFASRKALESNPLEVRPHNSALILFTSGSTGTPKGMIHEHQAMSTSLTSLCNILGLDGSARMIQFSAFTFDVSMNETLLTLMSGGTLIIPSEQERLGDLDGVITRRNVNWACLTPTVAALLHPERVPSLEHLVLAGEPVKKSDITTWASRLDLVNMYGPAEIVHGTTVRRVLSSTDRGQDIGHTTAVAAWIVDPEDTGRLLPPGALGELVLEGPLVAREYLKDPVKTSESFIRCPQWRQGTDLSTSGRFYRSGDLVRHNSDGSLYILGRRDTQIKLHGQRIELEDIEHQIKQGCKDYGNIRNSVVVFVTDPDTQKSMLVAVIEVAATGQELTSTKMLRHLNDTLAGQLRELKSYLHDEVPQYMVPSVYIPMSSLPLLASGKVDRKGLVADLRRLSPAELLEYSLSTHNASKALPATKLEQILVRLWASVLDLEVEMIGIDDHFFRLGGDSVLAMRLSAHARGEGLTIPVASIFQHPKLKQMARSISFYSDKTLQILHDQFEIERSDVEDIFPCTAMQTGLMLSSMAQPGTYASFFFRDLPEDIDLAALTSAWVRTVQRYQVLRTRIIDVGGVVGHVQVVTKSIPEITTVAVEVEKFSLENVDIRFEYGQVLNTAALVPQSTGRHAFVWTAHHSIYDKRSAELIFLHMSQLYSSPMSENELSMSEPVPYKSYVSRTLQADLLEARNFWKQSFPDAGYNTYPSRPSSAYKPVTHSYINHDFHVQRGMTSTELTHALLGAWSLVLSTYAESTENVTFGFAAQGLDGDISSNADLVGPTITTVPVSVSVSSFVSAKELLTEIERYCNATKPHAQFGLQNIKTISASTARACDFGSLISVSHCEYDKGGSLSQHVRAPPAPISYYLGVECDVSESHVSLTLQFDAQVLSSAAIQRIAYQFAHVAKQVVCQAGTRIKDINVVSPEDRHDLAIWNLDLPVKVRATVQELISRRTIQQPSSEAICSREAIITYAQLEEYSNRLANHLLSVFSVQRGDLIPLAFSMSPWFAVSMLGILKAGAAFVPMDPSIPLDRLKHIVDSTNAALILCSSDREEKARKLCDDVLVVDGEALLNFSDWTIPQVALDFNDIAYVVFTSGSTGVPKGVVIEHGSFLTGALPQGERLYVNEQSRVLHFASPAFDVCIQETLLVFLHGGCSCVPTDYERFEDVAKFMRDFDINVAALTPSFVRTIRPDQVPQLEVLLLGGEKMGADNLEIWAEKVKLINAYGPAEASIMSTASSRPMEYGDAADSVGTNCGCAVWIVDPEDATRLAPVGCVGELVVEGATVARGYLNDAVKTDGVFVDNPLWLFDHTGPSSPEFNGHANGKHNGTAKEHINGKSAHLESKALGNGSGMLNGHVNGYENSDTDGNGDAAILQNGLSSPPRIGGMNTHSRGKKVYKTGDLACYDLSGSVDGSIRILGRKDSQVKIRGQRVELGDIEHHIKSELRGSNHVAVDQVFVKTLEHAQLAAFISLDGQAQDEDCILLSIDENTRRDITQLDELLGKRIPSYMIPKLYIVVSHIPRTAGRKLDRKRLQRLAAELTADQVAHYSLVGSSKDPPSTGREKLLAEAWAETLGVPLSAIGKEDSFFRLGGDSIAVMRMTTAARYHGLQLTVAQVFKTPKLDQMAQNVVVVSDRGEAELQPFSLIQDSEDVQDLLNQIEQQYSIPKCNVQDILPVTPLQEGLMLLSLKTPGSYVSQTVLTLQPNVDVDRLRAAWKTVADRNSILRTTLAHTGRQTVQIIVKDRFEWHETKGNAEHYLQHDKSRKMQHGDALTRFAVIKDDQGLNTFVATAHHSLYDGWSFKIVYDEVDKLYNSPDYALSAVPPQFTTFINYLANVDTEAEASFWTKQFNNKSLASFPDPSTPSQPQEETVILQMMKDYSLVGSDVTMSNIIRAAWAIVSAKHANTEDVFFGAVLMGRNASLPKIEQMTGPTITTVPLCISVDREATIAQYLHAVTSQSTDMIPFEHTGLQNIKRLSPEARIACDFQNLLVIQPAGADKIDSNLWNEKVIFARGEMVTLTYSLIFECRLYKDAIRIGAQYRQNELPSVHVQRIVNQFEHVMRQLNCSQENMQKPLSSIDVASPQDIQELNHRNVESLDYYRGVDECIHRKFRAVAQLSPDKVAVDAWDAQLTYSELDLVTDKLAHHFKDLGVSPEVYVPVCFDKSAWAIVAMLAVLKAGGGYLCLDPKHPMDRKEIIMRDTDSKVVAVGEPYRDMFDQSKYQTVVVGFSTIHLLPTLREDPCPEVQASNTAFLVFTSGSTGVPKGIVMEHGAYCSGAKEHCIALGITSESRVMQFASYTYDVSFGEIFSTLLQGGCVCVPSEDQRMGDLGAAINSMKANWMFLTPTVAGFLRPEQVPTLQTLVLGGEHCTNDNIRVWSDKLNLINSYGPAECAIWCACKPYMKVGDDSSNLGEQIGATLWIIDPQDPNRLAPFGTVGELAVEGPTLARGYLNDEEKTQNAFIKDPSWAAGRSCRIYRTGDLVRYGPGGTLHIVGRKDTQVKLRGQRVELGEIEYHLTRLLPDNCFCVVEMLRPRAKDGDAMLSAFISSRELSSGNFDGQQTLPIPDQLKNTLREIQNDLEKAVPTHMIPTAYIFLRQLPMSAGGKADRKQLRQLGNDLSPDQLQSYAIDGSLAVVTEVTTSTEKLLRALWVDVLRADVDAIGKESNFLRIGGDSISAMKLSAAARQQGMTLSVRDVFMHPRLDAMAVAILATAKTSRSVQPALRESYKPFSTLDFVDDTESFFQNFVQPVIRKEMGGVEDIVMATDYQRWTFGCNQLQTRGYLNFFTLSIEGLLDEPKLEQACYQIVERHAILRTVFVAYRDRLLQVILRPDQRHDFHIRKIASQQQAAKDGMDTAHSFGDQLTSFYLASETPDMHSLTMRISHAQYDGISLPMIIEDLKRAYDGRELAQTAPFTSFVLGARQSHSLSKAEDVFRQLLSKSAMTEVVRHRGPSTSAVVDQSLSRSIKAPQSLLSQGFTFATIAKAAWSLVLSRLGSTSDVVFGQVSSGRNTDIDDIDRIVGPCLNLLPVRVDTQEHKTFASLLNCLQTQHLDMSAYETLGFQQIFEDCTQWPKWTRFSSILQHTSINIGIDEIDKRDQLTWQMSAFAPDHDVSDVWIWTGPKGEEEFYIDFTYSTQHISLASATTMVDMFCDVLDSMAPDANAAIIHDQTKEILLPLTPTGHTRVDASATNDALNEGSSNPAARIVHTAWTNVFGSGDDALHHDRTSDTPFFSIRGDLTTAAQLAFELASHTRRAITVEDIIDNPTMRQQHGLIH